MVHSGIMQWLIEIIFDEFSLYVGEFSKNAAERDFRKKSESLQFIN